MATKLSKDRVEANVKAVANTYKLLKNKNSSGAAAIKKVVESWMERGLEAAKAGTEPWGSEAGGKKTRIPWPNWVKSGESLLTNMAQIAAIQRPSLLDVLVQTATESTKQVQRGAEQIVKTARSPLFFLGAGIVGLGLVMIALKR